MLQEIKIDLADNFRDDEEVLKDIIDDVTNNALFISNREDTPQNRNILKYEIKECVKTIYLQRGTEDVVSLSESGRSSSYKDCMDQLRHNIIRNNKRLMR